MLILYFLELYMLMQAVILTRKVSGQVSAYVKPEYVVIGENATFTCIVPPQGDSDAVFWRNPYNADSCPRDCVDDSDDFTCTSGIVQLQQCWCEGNPSDGYCDAGTTNVTFLIQVNSNHIGVWTCYDSRGGGSAVDLKKFIKSSEPTITGDLELVEDTPTNLTCTSLDGNPPAQFQWFWSDGTMDHNVTDDAEDGGPGVSTILISPDRGYKAIKCVITQLEGKNPQETEEDLNILHGASVAIQPCPVTHIALRGSDVEFTCDITMTGNPTEGFYEWKKESVIIAGETGEVYRIPSVDVTHEAVYSCLFDNGQTEGRAESTTQLTVQYHPEAVVIAEGDTVVTENDTLTLTCSASALPPDVTYTWTGPGIDGDRVENPLVLDNIQVPNAGEYVCEAENTVTVCRGDTVIGGNSTTVNVRVYHNPSGPPTVTIDNVDDNTIAVDTDYDFQCDLDSLTREGDPPPSYILWHKDGVFWVNKTTECWQFVSHSVNDSGRYSCQCGNAVGVSDFSADEEITVEAPASIEYYINSTKNPIYDDGNNVRDFRLECLVSASNIDSVQILHNGTPILDKDNNFELAYSTENCHGSCEYDLSTAELLQVWWKVEDRSLTCAQIQSYDGVYVCRGSATTVGADADVTSEKISVIAHYSPIWKGDNLVQAEIGTKNLVMSCDICSNPRHIGYEWYFEGVQIPGAVNQNLTVPYVDEGKFGLYYCIVHQEVADKTFIVQLIEQGGTVNTGFVVGLTLLLLFLLIAACVTVILVMKGVIKLDCKQSNAHTDDTNNHNSTTRSKVNYENTGFVRDNYNGNEKDKGFSDISSEYLELGDSREDDEVPLDQKTAIHKVLGKHPDGSHDDDYEEFEVSGDVSRPQGVTYESLSSSTHQNVPAMIESEKHYQSLQKGTAV